MQTESRDLHLLVFDDDKGRRDDLARACGEQQYVTVTAEGIDEALDLAARRRFGLAVIGVGRGATDGHRLLTELKGDPRTRQIPVVIVAAAGDQESIRQCLQAGADDYLVEPYDPALLTFRISTCFGRRRLQAKLVDDLTRVILPLGAALSAEKDSDKLLERIVEEAKNVCNADAGTLYIRTDDDRLAFSIMRTDSLGLALGGKADPPVPFPPLPMYDPLTGEPNERNIASYVALHAQSINIPDVYKVTEFDFSGTRIFDQRNNYRSTSCLAVPLKDHMSNVIGVVQLLNAQDPATGEAIPFDAYAQQVLESLASLAAIALTNQRLLRRQEALLRFERDLQIGRQIQEHFLPDELPTPAGWDIAAYFRPAREVGGDFYDVFYLPGQHHVGLVIADVSDKGVAAALFMALIRSLIRAFSEQHTSYGIAALSQQPQVAEDDAPNPRLASLLADFSAINTILMTNNYLVKNHSETNMFATLFWGVLDPATGLLTYVNCGHNAPMIVNGNGVKASLEPTGPALGLFPNMRLDIGEAEIGPGEMLFTYTDGVTDARNAEGTFFGEQRLQSLMDTVLKDGPRRSAGELLGHVEEVIRSHVGASDQFDDITMLAAVRSP